eukprot:212019-Pyramimonas_sp.AAC.1
MYASSHTDAQARSESMNLPALDYLNKVERSAFGQSMRSPRDRTTSIADCVGEIPFKSVQENVR